MFNHADYRLLSRRAIETLKQFGERNLFLRGIIPQLGFNSSVVDDDRQERVAGESKYPVRKMLSFAFEGITSFSAGPLKLITLLGSVVAAGTFLIAVWALWVRTFNSAAVPGWASTVIPLYFLGRHSTPVHRDHRSMTGRSTSKRRRVRGSRSKGWCRGAVRIALV